MKSVHDLTPPFICFTLHSGIFPGRHLTFPPQFQSLDVLVGLMTTNTTLKPSPGCLDFLCRGWSKNHPGVYQYFPWKCSILQTLHVQAEDGNPSHPFASFLH